MKLFGTLVPYGISHLKLLFNVFFCIHLKLLISLILYECSYGDCLMKLCWSKLLFLSLYGLVYTNNSIILCIAICTHKYLKAYHLLLQAISVDCEVQNFTEGYPDSTRGSIYHWFPFMKYLMLFRHLREPRQTKISKLWRFYEQLRWLNLVKKAFHFISLLN